MVFSAIFLCYHVSEPRIIILVKHTQVDASTTFYYHQVALNFVINYEEGGEACTLHGDNQSETLLSDIVGAAAYGEFYFPLYIAELIILIVLLL